MRLQILVIAVLAPAFATLLTQSSARSSIEEQAPGRNGCAWFDILQLCQAIEAPVDDAIDHVKDLTFEAKEAAKEVVDDFMNQLGGVLEKVEMAVLRIEKQSVADAKALIKDVSSAITSVTDRVVSKLEELVGKTVSEVKNALKAVIGDVSSLVSLIFDKVTATLHEFEEFTWKVLCTGEGMIQQLERFLTGGSMTQNSADCSCVHDAAIMWEDSCASACTCKKHIIGGKLTCPCNIPAWESVNDDHKMFTAVKDHPRQLKRSRKIVRWRSCNASRKHSN